MKLSYVPADKNLHFEIEQQRHYDHSVWIFQHQFSIIGQGTIVFLNLIKKISSIYIDSNFISDHWRSFDVFFGTDTIPSGWRNIDDDCFTSDRKLSVVALLKTF